MQLMHFTLLCLPCCPYRTEGTPTTRRRAPPRSASRSWLVLCSPFNITTANVPPLTTVGERRVFTGSPIQSRLRTDAEQGGIVLLGVHSAVRVIQTGKPLVWSDRKKATEQAKKVKAFYLANAKSEDTAVCCDSGARRIPRTPQHAAVPHLRGFILPPPGHQLQLFEARGVTRPRENGGRFITARQGDITATLAPFPLKERFPGSALHSRPAYQIPFRSSHAEMRAEAGPDPGFPDARVHPESIRPVFEGGGPLVPLAFDIPTTNPGCQRPSTERSISSALDTVRAVRRAASRKDQKRI
ncbi:hypothetical protein SKAU_G00001330 [Synaphobranchus kaupii]|uniref:Uncharacterized protein n=1 Tax=Synaphobranchus kaupii TaxID=118154 RepID=A0A9Q1G8A1_SYNKA|nr:hypothetical protein SKAU_G00001330 [Synaphobranchus kaupii]